FFQAEDGIRDPLVTGVQTCALPIYAHRDLATLLQCDQRRPEPDAADEVLRAVDRVDDPAHLVRSVPAELLAEGAVRREGASEDLDDRLLGFAVGPGDRCGVGLERDFDALLDVLERDLPRR